MYEDTSKMGKMELKDGYLVQRFKAHAQINTYFPWITEDPSEMQPDSTAVLLNKKATDLLHNSTDIFKYRSSFTTVINECILYYHQILSLLNISDLGHPSQRTAPAKTEAVADKNPCSLTAACYEVDSGCLSTQT